MHAVAKNFFAGLRAEREEGQALGVVGGDITSILGKVTAALTSAL